MKFKKFGIAFAQVQVNQALITGNTMLFVHYRVADLEFGEVAQPVFQRRFALRIALGAAGLGRRTAGIEFGFGDEGEFFCFADHEAGKQGPDTQREAGSAGHECGGIGGRVGLDVIFNKQFGQCFTATCRFGEQQAAAREGRQETFERAERILGPAVDGY